MSTAANGESKFGFKDKEKAEETLQLLESHDIQYRKLTVRGLLGRAKRVLTMTKATEKVANITAAIEIFEKWLEENGGGAANKNAKTDKDDKVETVPGLGFKDKDTAEATLRILKDRDPEYQKLAIKGLIGNSKRVLSTKNEEKMTAMHEGVKTLEDFLEKFETENMMKNNRAYLTYSLMEQLPEAKDELAAEFAKTYGGTKAKGNYKHLRTMYPEGDNSKSWDIVRNKNIAKIMNKLKAEDAKLFDSETGAPTAIHMELLHWAYSPQPDKVKAYLEKNKKKTAEKRKCESSTDSSDDDSDSGTDGDTPKKRAKKSS